MSPAATSSSTSSSDGLGAEQLPRRRQQRRQRQAGAAAALGLGEHVHDRRALARGPSPTGVPAAQRDPVGDQEADPEHARQLVRVGARAISWAPVAVVLVDPRRQIGEAVGREQQVKPARDAERLPRLGRLLGAVRRAARPRRTPPRVAVDRVQHPGGAEAVDELGGALGADVLDPAQVGDQRLRVLGRQRPGLGHLDLAAVAAVVDPGPDDAGRARAPRGAPAARRAPPGCRQRAAASTTAQPVASLA